MFIKTREEPFGWVEKSIKDKHPYQLSEIIALEIEKVSREYLNWLKYETEDKK